MFLVVLLGIFDIFSSLVFFFNLKAVALVLAVLLFLKAIYTFVASSSLFDPLGLLDLFASFALFLMQVGYSYTPLSLVMAILFLKGLYSIISL